MRGALFVLLCAALLAPLASASAQALQHLMASDPQLSITRQMLFVNNVTFNQTANVAFLPSNAAWEDVPDTIRFLFANDTTVLRYYVQEVWSANDPALGGQEQQQNQNQTQSAAGQQEQNQTAAQQNQTAAAGQEQNQTAAQQNQTAAAGQEQNQTASENPQVQQGNQTQPGQQNATAPQSRTQLLGNVRISNFTTYDNAPVILINGARVDRVINSSDAKIYITTSIVFPALSENLAEIAMDAGHTNWTAYLKRFSNDTAAQLNNKTAAFTIFAPTDQAFSSLEPRLLRFIISHPTLARLILLTHIVPDFAFADAWRDGQRLPTLSGTPLNVTRQGDDEAAVNGEEVAMADQLLVANGLFVPVDRLFVPEFVTRLANGWSG